MTSLFYSRLELRPRAYGAPWSRLRDPYEVHRALWTAFDGVKPGTSAPFLFRADRVKVEDALRLRVLVQSKVEPRWERLEDVLVDVQRSTPKDDSWLRDRLQCGTVLRFFLRANPTRAVRPWGPVRDTRGKRVAIEGEAEQRQWLLRHLEQAGARICTRVVSVRSDRGEEIERREELELRTSNARVWRWGNPRGKHGVHQGVDFEGLLEVVDTEPLVLAVSNGVGPAKGLGFGLLSLAPVRA